MKRAARERVGKAEDDYEAAKILAQDKQRLYDQLCFHCQQSAEKYLKAILEELGLSIQKSHELELLLNQLLPNHPSLRSLRRGVKFLTNFSVTIRYPGDDATRRQAKSALRWAEMVRVACRAALKLPP